MTSEPTETELALGMSLPADLRNLPPEEVLARQSLLGGQSDPGRGRRFNRISGGSGRKVGGTETTIVEAEPEQQPPEEQMTPIPEADRVSLTQRQAFHMGPPSFIPEEKREAFTLPAIEETIVTTGLRPLPFGPTPFSLGREPEESVELKRGFVRGVFPSTKTELITTGISAGAGAGIGAGTRVASAGITRFAPKLQQPASLVAGVGGVALGEIFVAEKIKGVTEAPTPSVRGEIVGGGVRELVGFGAGFRGGEKAVGKAIGVVRTRGMKEIPAEDVVAPEFFEGQRFPAIKRGQTAGELLGEFKPMLPGETRPAGFTAADRPLTGETFGRGSSELPGLFQAPKISPQFLRLGKGESPQLVGPLTGGLPTVFRTTPTRTRLAPGVSPRQTRLAPVKRTREFFETAPKGESIVPFIKTEKEAVIPFGTEFKQTQRRFFFKFEGERVPILEVQTVGGKAPKGRGRTFKTEDVILRSSSGRRRSPSSSIGAVSLVSGKPPTSRDIPSSLGFGPSRPSGSGRRPSPDRILEDPLRPPSRGGSSIRRPPSDIISPPPSRPSSSLIQRPSRPRGVGGLFLPGLGFGDAPLPGRKPKRKLKRQPSLIAANLGITGKEIKTLEETGLAIRPL